MSNAYLSLPAISLILGSAALLAQDPAPLNSNQIISVQTSEAQIEGLYIMPIGDEPFTARIEGRVVSEPALLTAPYLGLEQSGWIPPLTGSIDYSWLWAGVQFSGSWLEMRLAKSIMNREGRHSPETQQAGFHLLSKSGLLSSTSSTHRNTREPGV